MKSRALQLLVLLLCAASVDAGTTPRSVATHYLLEMPAQPLAASLQQLAESSGKQIVFLSSVTEGLEAPALAGEFTVNDALQRLLAGSGLGFRQINGRAIEVLSGVPGAAADAAAPGSRPRSARRSRRAGAWAPEPMEEILVVGMAEQLVASRIPTPLIDIPQSVSVMSAEQMRQQNQEELGDVLKRAAGVSTRRVNSLEMYFYSRGFQISSFHVDGGGSQLPSLYSGPTDLSEFDRVEVLRGSDAFFSGNTNPGGAVSLVRKRPTATPRVELTATLGSWNHRRVELDMSGPLNGDGSLRGRADATYTDRDYYFDRAHLERKKLYGVLEYDLTEDSMLTAGGSFQRDDAVPAIAGLPLNDDGSDSRLPRNLSLIAPWAFFDADIGNAYLQYRGRPWDGWTLAVNTQATRAKVDYGYVAFLGAVIRENRSLDSLPAAGFTLRPDMHTQITADVTLAGEFDWLGLRHEVSFGGDYSHFRVNRSVIAYVDVARLENVYDFDPRNYPDPRRAGLPPAWLAQTLQLEQYGVFASWRVHLGERWSTTLGGRLSTDVFDGAATIGINQGVNAGLELQDEVTFGSSDVRTPYAAVMYRIDGHHTLYTSLADVYLTQSTRLAVDGSKLPPAHGVNLETGIKGVWRDGALNGFLALYRIAQRGLPFSVRWPGRPADRPPNCCYRGATSYSYGVELDLNGQLVPGLLVGGGYTYNVNERAIGGRLESPTPRHMLKLWTSWELPGALANWSLGGSLRAQNRAASGIQQYCYSGRTPQCRDIELFQEPFAVLDLRGGYQLNENWRLALSVNNVFDKIYYDSITAPLTNGWYGEPRNLLLRVDGTF
ncbi:MAG: TonB-dependent siderophore receptor [Pseudomonadota bacterium]